ADEDLHPFRRAGEVEQADEGILRFQEREELADALQILQRVHVLQELRLTAQNQGTTAAGLAARPAREAALDHARGELVELRALLLQLLQDVAVRLFQG